jgi:hypothetical protein
MAVRIQKPAVNIREKLAELERPIGLKGSELMKAETAQDARDFVSAGRKNLIINGGMDVWQRGTSFLDPASSSYTADRWKNSTNPTDISRSTDVPSGQPFTYSMLMAANGSGGTRHAALQGVELPATGNSGPFKVGTTWTFSCWLKGGANGSIFFGTDFRNDPNDGTNAVAISSTTFNYTTSWQRFTHTFTVGVSPVGTNLCLAIILFNATAPTHSLNITGCQLEVGKNATEFENRSFGEELVLCERYCQGFPIGGRHAIGNWSSGTVAYCTTALRTTMRTTPTLYSYTPGNVLVESVNWYAATTVTLTEATNTTVTFYISGITNSGQSANANAAWGNGASAVISAEF